MREMGPSFVTVAAQGFYRSRVRNCYHLPRRSKLCIACSDLFYKSERAHTAVPPFHPANALPVCGARRRGPWNVGIFLLVPLRFAVKVFCGEFGVLHIVESISLVKTEKQIKSAKSCNKSHRSCVLRVESSSHKRKRIRRHL